MTESLKKKLDKLRQEYISSLQGKVKKVSHLVKQIRTKYWNSEKRDVLITLIHRMVGSGKTFGVDELTDVAFELEKLLKEELKANKIVTMSLKNEINDYVEKLVDIARKAGDKESEYYLKKKPEQIDNALDRGKKAFLFLQEQMNSSLKDQFKLYGYTLTRCTKIQDIKKHTPLGRNVIILFEISYLKRNKIDVDNIINLCEDKKGMHIVVLSDDDTLKKRLIAARIGADAFMTAPFDVSVLINKLNLITQNRGYEPYHILIVDDDVEFVAWCAYTLQKEGMITSVVTKPEYVISELIESRPELVLMDWHMPGYTGFDLASIIRQQDAFVSIPIVFLTAESDSDIKMKAMRIGADDFLVNVI